MTCYIVFKINQTSFEFGPDRYTRILINVHIVNITMEKATKPDLSISEILREFEKSLGFKNEIKWPSFIAITLYHIIGVYWCYNYAFPVKWQTLVFGKHLILFV